MIRGLAAEPVGDRAGAVFGCFPPVVVARLAVDIAHRLGRRVVAAERAFEGV